MPASLAPAKHGRHKACPTSSTRSPPYDAFRPLVFASRSTTLFTVRLHASSKEQLREQRTISQMIDYESPSARTLLAIARRRHGIDDERCRLAFEQLGAADRLRRCLHSTLVGHQLSDLQFAALVVLFDLEPRPISMAMLAEHIGVSRSAVTDAVDKLEALQLASRSHDSGDRRVTHMRISKAGHEKVDRVINDYLQVITHGAATKAPGGMATKRLKNRLSCGREPVAHLSAR